MEIARIDGRAGKGGKRGLQVTPGHGQGNVQIGEKRVGGAVVGEAREGEDLVQLET